MLFTYVDFINADLGCMNEGQSFFGEAKRPEPHGPSW